MQSFTKFLRQPVLVSPLLLASVLAFNALSHSASVTLTIQ